MSIDSSNKSCTALFRRSPFPFARALNASHVSALIVIRTCFSFGCTKLGMGLI